MFTLACSLGTQSPWSGGKVAGSHGGSWSHCICSQENERGLLSPFYTDQDLSIGNSGIELLSVLLNLSRNALTGTPRVCMFPW